MVKKGKKKQAKARSYKKLSPSPPKTRPTRLRKRRHAKNWKAESNDPVRLGVERDGTRSIVDMLADGNCLYRSISDQLFNDFGDKHEDIRMEVCDYMEDHEDDFAAFLVLDEDEEDEDAADYSSYLDKMRRDGEWGGNLELAAAAQLFGRNILVFSPGNAFTISHGKKKSRGPDLFLSYHDNDHYNSVRTGSFTPRSVSSTDESTDPMDEQKEDEATARPEKNDPCPCGSKKKFKKCCLKAEKHKARLERMNISASDEEDKAELKEMIDDEFRVLVI